TDTELTRLPRNHTEGDIPQMAIATGEADAFECVLRKIGISDSEFTSPSGSGRIHMYQANGATLAGGVPPDSALWSDMATLRQYDIVILPCEVREVRKPNAGLQNLVDYTSAGGRVFATHYSYVWLAYGAAPFPSTADWRPDTSQTDNPPNPFEVQVNQSFP